ncbi:MAG: 5'/3'-nucleotidase SurE [Candidatus Krumholzibacteriota bacterium]|nr:5'/3'-nucleotidase SurE [Candidatus Krumholzibacteriota bacterium]
MTILVTNDDGIRAEGIKALTGKLERLGRIITVAPENEQSATSHAITLDKPLRITNYSRNRTGVHGTPTDCLLLGIHGILGYKPDLVVSGINHGPNMGEDVTYSGTVAAAIEGYILGIPSIAVSLTSWEPVDFSAAADISAFLAEKMLDSAFPKPSLWNVNIPPLPADKIRGIKITKLGSRIYNDIITKHVDPRGKDCFWIGGGEPGWSDEENTDFAAVSSGFVSITPLRVDLTDYKNIFELKKWGWEWKPN